MTLVFMLRAKLTGWIYELFMSIVGPACTPVCMCVYALRPVSGNNVTQCYLGTLVL